LFNCTPITSASYLARSSSASASGAAYCVVIGAIRAIDTEDEQEVRHNAAITELHEFVIRRLGVAATVRMQLKVIWSRMAQPLATIPNEGHILASEAFAGLGR
jgi:hypothetical protein